MFPNLPSLQGLIPRRYGLLSWCDHIPFAFDLVANFKPKLLVELGTHSGESYFAFCQAAQQYSTDTTCYAIDTWQGDFQAGFYSSYIYENVHAHNRQYYNSFSYLIRSTFDEAKDQFIDNTIDILHIDGLHTYEAVKHDYETWISKVSDRGIILFHDIAARQKDFGAWKLWEELSKNAGKNGSFTFHHGWGLGVLRKNPDIPLPPNPWLEKLFSNDAAEQEYVRRYYVLASKSLQIQASQKDGVSETELLKKVSANPNTLEEQSAHSKFESDTPNIARLKLCFSDSDNDFSEENSTSLIELPEGEWRQLTIPIPQNYIGRRIRIDPIEVPGLIEINEIKLLAWKDNKPQLIWAYPGEGKFKDNLTLAPKIIKLPAFQTLKLFSLKEDAHIILPPIDFANGDAVLDTVTLEIAIRACVNFLSANKDTLSQATSKTLFSGFNKASKQKDHLSFQIQSLEREVKNILTSEEFYKKSLEQTEAEVHELHTNLCHYQYSEQESLSEIAQQKEENRQLRLMIEEKDKSLSAFLESRLPSIRENSATDSEKECPGEAIFEFYLDNEVDWNNLPKPFYLRGWCLGRHITCRNLDRYKDVNAKSSGVIASMYVQYNGKKVPGVYGVPRPDVPSALNLSDKWTNCGFDIPIHLLSGKSQFTLMVEDAEGQCWPLKHFNVQSFYELSNAQCENVSKLKKDLPFRYFLDYPQDWSLPSHTLRMSGWCMPKELPADITPEEANKFIKEIHLRCGNQVVKTTHKTMRLDVAQAFHFDDKYAQCGFSFETQLPPGRSIVTLEIIDNEDKVWEAGQYHVRTPYLFNPEYALEADLPNTYLDWIRLNETYSSKDYVNIRQEIKSFQYQPLISIVMPTFNTTEVWLRKAIESVQEQTYLNWELCIADDASTEPHVLQILKQFSQEDSRIKVHYRASNGHISAASNSALELATGEFIALLDHDDELSPSALYAVVKELNKFPDAEVIYSDEDKIDAQGRRFDPYFKPDWNPDLLTGQNCISHLGVYRTSQIREVGGFREGLEGCQDWDLALRITEKIEPNKIRHIPHILYHWRAIPGSTSIGVEQKDYIHRASDQVLKDHCSRLNLQADILRVEGGHRRIRYHLPESIPLTSIIIPTHNQRDILKKCIQSIRDKTTYLNYEIIVVDNQSDDPLTQTYLKQVVNMNTRVLDFPWEFNYSAINNFAVSHARGSIICLLNNDVEIINSDWLDEMVSHAVRPGVGAVGAMLYYPDNTIQHAGVVLGLGGVAGHIFSRQHRGSSGYFNRARLVQNYSAVTGACLVVKRSIYEQVGGLDEKKLTVAFNDVDFCLRIQAMGYRNVWTPYAELYHHESVSRGHDKTPTKYERFRSEVEYMKQQWAPLISNDPAYNLNLTFEHGDCRPCMVTRAEKLNKQCCSNGEKHFVRK